MNSFSALRGLCAAACVACPLVIVVACSQPASHPPVIGDCAGPNCVSGGGASGSGTGGSGGGGDGSTGGGGDSSTSGGDAGTGIDDSGSVGGD